MTIPDATKYLGITRQSVHKAINKGHIRVVEVIAGRRLLHKGDVEKYKPRAKRLNPATTEDKTC